jgi:hypothetical protein
MNLDRASMEPFRRYSDFHNDVNVRFLFLVALLETPMRSQLLPVRGMFRVAPRSPPTQ